MREQWRSPDRPFVKIKIDVVQPKGFDAGSVCCDVRVCMSKHRHYPDQPLVQVKVDVVRQ